MFATKEPVVLTSRRSVAVQVTRVFPSGKSEPEAGLQATGTGFPFQSSAFVVNATKAPSRPCGSAVTPLGTLSVGGEGGSASAELAATSAQATSTASERRSIEGSSHTRSACSSTCLSGDSTARGEAKSPRRPAPFSKRTTGFPAPRPGEARHVAVCALLPRG